MELGKRKTKELCRKMRGNLSLKIWSTTEGFLCCCSVRHGCYDWENRKVITRISV